MSSSLNSISDSDLVHLRKIYTLPTGKKNDNVVNSIESLVDLKIPKNLYTYRTEYYDQMIHRNNKKFMKGYIKRYENERIKNITYKYYKESNDQYILSSSIKTSDMNYCVFHSSKILRFDEDVWNQPHSGDIAILEKGLETGVYILRRYTRLTKSLSKRKDDIMLIYISPDICQGVPPSVHIHILPFSLQYNKKYNPKYSLSPLESICVYNYIEDIEYHPSKECSTESNSSLINSIKQTTHYLWSQLSLEPDHDEEKKNVIHMKNKEISFDPIKYEWKYDFGDRSSVPYLYETILEYYSPNCKKYLETLRISKRDFDLFNLDIYTLLTPLQGFAVFMALQLYEIENKNSPF
ncbi:hypothetical protein WA158_006284 [Blastocystis sp. Blastoise]